MSIELITKMNDVRRIFCSSNGMFVEDAVARSMAGHQKESCKPEEGL